MQESTLDRKVKSYMRVNHAGERGAVAIYQGQLWALRKSDCVPILEDMLEQEKQHLKTFDALLPEYNVRPSLLDPLWRVGGFALGAATAALGARAAMACTVAVEEVIVAHYQEQLDCVQDEKLQQTIHAFAEDEAHHRDEALHHKAHEAPFYNILHGFVTTLTKAAIAVAKRI